MAFYLLTEINLAYQRKDNFPDGNLILREDCQKSFKKEGRFNDTIAFLKIEGIGSVYPSITNSEKERLVSRPLRVDGIYEGYNKKKHEVIMANIFGVEKLWRGVYEAAQQHRDF